MPAETRDRFRLAEIGQIAITVEDVERATAFYRDVLGMEPLFQAPPAMSFFRCGGVRLLLGEAEGEDHPSHILYYKTDDIQAACETLKKRGVEFTQEPHRVHADDRHELWLASFRDADGHTLQLMSEVAV